MPQLELAAGTIEYQDTGGDGPVLVFLHALTMDGSLWRKVVPGLVPDYRCVLPTLPLGGHRRPMRPGSCEAFGNYPPRPARAMVLAARIPGGLATMMWLLRLRAVRRAPGSWGWMSKRPVDRVMPRRHGRRLADLFPDARLIETGDSYTLLPEDQPERLVRALGDFVPAARRSTPLLNNAPIRPAPRAGRGR